MNKLLKIAGVFGTASQIVLAGVALTDIIMRFRGARKTTEIEVEEIDSPQPELSPAA